MLSCTADSDRLFAGFIVFYEGVFSFPILVSVLIFHVLSRYIEKSGIMVKNAFTKKNVNVAESCVDIKYTRCIWYL